MGSREINLDGIETSIIKALGFGSTEVTGEDLMAKVSDLAGAELIDSLHGLIDMGYVSADKAAFYSTEDMQKILFRVNSGYAKDLREALDPRPQKPKSRRVRRE